jgi:DNA-binding PadR family transcriptional regulator
MSLANAILVSLVDASQSGYDLAKQFDGSVGFFWQATHQQIYRELTKLEEKEYVKSEAIAQEGRPDKKLFSLTVKGKAELKRWLAEPSDLPSVKDEFLLKLFAGHLIPIAIHQTEMKRQRQLHQERLEVYLSIEQKFFPNPAAIPLKYKFRHFTLLRGIKLERDWIAWCDEMLPYLENIRE